MTKGITFLVFISLSFGLFGQDWQSIYLKGRFDTIGEVFWGETWQQVNELKGSDTLVLNAIRMEILDLQVNEESSPFYKNDTALFIPIKADLDRLELYIYYKAKPRKGLYFIGWQDSTFRSRRQIWTQGQGIDHRHWIPHHDDQKDKILFRAEWIFNADYEIMSNGRLDSSWLVEGEKHWFYSMDKPMSSYLIAVAIDRYERSESEVNGIPHYLYHYPERVADSAWYYYQHDSIAALIERDIGVAYPWPNYKQAPVQDFRHGAMENTCATIFGDFFLVDSIAFYDQNYSYVDAHEFAHQWFGNLVTAESSKHHWLHEGFATYYQWYSEMHLYGYNYFYWELKKAKEMVFEASRRDTLPLAHPKAGSERFYQKGGWLVHMLRNYVGDSVYHVAIKDYLNSYAYQVARNQDFIGVFKRHSNKDIDGFFDLWLYGKQEPKLKELGREGDYFLFESSHRLSQKIKLDVLANGVWRFVEAEVKKGLNRILLPEGTTDAFIYNAHELLVEVEYMPVGWKLSRQRFLHRSLDIVQYQILKDLKVEKDPDLLSFLKVVVKNEAFHFASRQEAFERLSEILDAKERLSLWQDMVQASQDIQFKKSLVNWALNHKLKASPKVLAELRRAKSYELRKAALELSLDPSNAASNRWLYDPIYEKEPGIVGRNVYLEALLFRVYLYQDPKAYEALLDFATPSFDFNTRINALGYLALLQHPDFRYLDVLWQAFFNSNWKLVRVARQGLERIKEGQEDIWLNYYQKAQENWTDFQKRKAARTFE